MNRKFVGEWLYGFKKCVSPWGSLKSRIDTLEFLHPRGWVLKIGSDEQVIGDVTATDARTVAFNRGFFSVEPLTTTEFETSGLESDWRWLLRPSGPNTPGKPDPRIPHHDFEFLVKNGIRQDIQLIVDGVQLGFLEAPDGSTLVVSRQDFPDNRRFVKT